MALLGLPAEETEVHELWVRCVEGKAVLDVLVQGAPGLVSPFRVSPWWKVSMLLGQAKCSCVEAPCTVQVDLLPKPERLGRQLSGCDQILTW